LDWVYFNPDNANDVKYKWLELISTKEDAQDFIKNFSYLSEKDKEILSRLK
jgi:hypothetical protein